MVNIPTDANKNINTTNIFNFRKYNNNEIDYAVPTRGYATIFVYCNRFI